LVAILMDLRNHEIALSLHKNFYAHENYVLSALVSEYSSMMERIQSEVKITLNNLENEFQEKLLDKIEVTLICAILQGIEFE